MVTSPDRSVASSRNGKEMGCLGVTACLVLLLLAIWGTVEAVQYVTEGRCYDDLAGFYEPNKLGLPSCHFHHTASKDLFAYGWLGVLAFAFIAILGMVLFTSSLRARAARTATEEQASGGLEEGLYTHERCGAVVQAVLGGYRVTISQLPLNPPGGPYAVYYTRSEFNYAPKPPESIGSADLTCRCGWPLVQAELVPWQIEDSAWWRAYHSPQGVAVRDARARALERPSAATVREAFRNNGKLRWRILARDNYTCQQCGATGTTAELTVDHINPVVRGGDNGQDNLQTLCRSCNSRKGPRTA